VLLPRPTGEGIHTATTTQVPKKQRVLNPNKKKTSGAAIVFVKIVFNDKNRIQ
jgi:hypothetical protein